MSEQWLFLDTKPMSPAMNMALDEALLNWHSEGKIPPVLRFYTWEPAALSLGYFQKIRGKIDVEAVYRHGFELVRRPTGGRAVLHDHELTYSTIVSEQHEKMPQTVTEAYRVLSKGVLEGFRNLGLQAEFSIPEGKLPKTNSANCFDQPSWYELVVEGRKVAGSAQTRQKGVILQHGSVPIELDKDVLFDLFLYPNERVKQRARKSFEQKAISINELSREPKTIHDVKTAFKKGFEKGLNVDLKPFYLSQEQLAEVEELAETRYQTEAWTMSR
ncbi:lipoate--protein ligase family protein [Salinibacillus xinjiangensis]|uniref:Octanoyltransferase n=1 Tax=Salinibacillus xinjiangensis TaxID=1229268 RepID=A0A6G1X5X1_9BACI|nr:biotin/lipoate A/B protein ligase family protein [Salinibacillus xinjiangensis]MRG86280.1 octanoyltransferase [Salinibacillus xinjiangensis]